MDEILDYNTQRERLRIPEYGRIIYDMVQQLKQIEDKNKRTEQARAVVKVMELLNPHVKTQENFERKLWDHLFIIADFELDVDAPYPIPVKSELVARPVQVPINKKPVKATHYGRNIESIIDLIAGLEDNDNKTELIRSLAIYMRQQYLIWNKDSVADETIFSDIEKLSDGRIKVPAGLELSKISAAANFSRPGVPLKGGMQKAAKNRRFPKKNHHKPISK